MAIFSVRMRLLLLIISVEGFLAVWMTQVIPSEASAAFWLGYSKPRLALAGIGLLVAVFLAVAVGLSLLRPTQFLAWAARIHLWLTKDNRLLNVTLSLGVVALLAAWSFLFTWLFVPAPLRWMLAWAGLAAIQTLVWLVIALPDLYAEKRVAARFFDLPRMRNLNAYQRKVLKTLLVIGALYWAAFIYPNLQNSDAHTLQFSGGDEGIIYPVFTHMFAPASSFQEGMYFFFLYEDYHYGFPFYLLSALTVLPLHLLSGGRLAEASQLGLLLLRQFISAAPLVLAAIVLVWMQTRFRSLWKAASLFGLLLIIPEMVNYCICFWHPDGLTTLSVALTLFFLDRDRMRFGANFYLAAAFCGLASSLRLYGFFFVLAIPVYLIAAGAREKKPWNALMWHAVGFVGVMLAVFILSSPYLLDDHARSQAIAILFSKTDEFAHGYTGIQDTAGLFQMGLGSALKWVSYPYAPPVFLLFLLGSLGAACVYGREKFANRLIFLWILPPTVYLVWFVAVRSSHYWLPVMLPLYSAAFGLAGPLEEIALPGWAKIAGWLALGLTLAGLAGTSAYLIFAYFV